MILLIVLIRPVAFSKRFHIYPEQCEQVKRIKGKRIKTNTELCEHSLSLNFPNTDKYCNKILATNLFLKGCQFVPLMQSSVFSCDVLDTISINGSHRCNLSQSCGKRSYVCILKEKCQLLGANNPSSSKLWWFLSESGLSSNSLILIFNSRFSNKILLENSLPCCNRSFVLFRLEVSSPRSENVAKVKSSLLEVCVLWSLCMVTFFFVANCRLLFTEETSLFGLELIKKPQLDMA